MRLQLKPNFRYDRYTVQTGGKTIVTYDRDTERVTIRYCGMTQTIDVTDGVSWVKTAFLAFNAAGWHNPWNNVATDADDHADAELTAAAEGEGPVAPVAPAPRLCAVDRLEAAGYELHVDEDERCIKAVHPDRPFHGLRFKNKIGSRKWTAWIDWQASSEDLSVYARGDESPGLNAALESLLSKHVGAVTVAQILGVA